METLTTIQKALEWWDRLPVNGLNNSKDYYANMYYGVNKHTAIDGSEIEYIYIKEHPQEEAVHSVDTLEEAAENHGRQMADEGDYFGDIYNASKDSFIDGSEWKEKQMQPLVDMLNKILNIEDGAFGLYGFDIKRLKEEIKAALK